MTLRVTQDYVTTDGCLLLHGFTFLGLHQPVITSEQVRLGDENEMIPVSQIERRLRLQRGAYYVPVQMCNSVARLVALHFVPFVWSAPFGTLYTWTGL